MWEVFCNYTKVSDNYKVLILVCVEVSVGAIVVSNERYTGIQVLILVCVEVSVGVCTGKYRGMETNPS